MPSPELLIAVKRQAQRLKRLQPMKLSAAQELLARGYGFRDFHELSVVAANDPADGRFSSALIAPNGPPVADDDWRSALERQARRLASGLTVPLQMAADLVARTRGFASASEVTVETFEDVFQSVYAEVDRWLDDALSGEIAETNAVMYMIDTYDSVEGIYDHGSGTVTLQVELSYAGDHDDERPWCGDSFDLEIECEVARGAAGWELKESSVISVRGNY